MNKEMYEKVLNDIHRLEYLNNELENLSEFAKKISEGNKECRLKISYPKDDNEKVTLDDDGNLNYGNNEPGMFLFLKKDTEECYELNINETVSLNVIHYIYDGMMKEKSSLEKKLSKVRLNTLSI